jgi:hypothetical protein
MVLPCHSNGLRWRTTADIARGVTLCGARRTCDAGRPRRVGRCFRGKFRRAAGFKLYTSQSQENADVPILVTLAYADSAYAANSYKAILPCFNLRLYFHGLPPHSMSELPTDTLSSLYITKARRNFPGEPFTILLHSCQSKNADYGRNLLRFGIFAIIYATI